MAVIGVSDLAAPAKKRLSTCFCCIWWRPIRTSGVRLLNVWL